MKEKSIVSRCSCTVYPFVYRNMTREGNIPEKLMTIPSPNQSSYFGGVDFIGGETSANPITGERYFEESISRYHPSFCHKYDLVSPSCRTPEEIAELNSKESQQYFDDPDIRMIPDETNPFLSTGVVDLKGIIGFNYSKNLKSPAGKFTITTLADKDYLRLIAPGDWLIFNFHQNNTSVFHHRRFIGNIDRVAKNFQITDDGKQQETFTIYGSDFGKVFETFKLYINPYDPTGVVQQAVLTELGMNALSGSAAHLVATLLAILYRNPSQGTYSGMNSINQFLLPSALTNELLKGAQNEPDPAYNLLGQEPAIFQQNTGIPNLLDGDRVSDVLVLQLEKDIPGLKTNSGEGLVGEDAIVTAWDLLKSNSNAPVINELFLETDNYSGRPILYLRPVPFSRKKSPYIDRVSTSGFRDLLYKYAFKTLSAVKIITADILKSDLGVSDAERFNYFLVSSTFADGLSKASKVLVSTKEGFPLFDKYSIAAHGFRIFRPQTLFYPSGVKLTSSLTTRTVSNSQDSSNAVKRNAVIQNSQDYFKQADAKIAELQAQLDSGVFPQGRTRESTKINMQTLIDNKNSLIEKSREGDDSDSTPPFNTEVGDYSSPWSQINKIIKSGECLEDLIFDWNLLCYENNVNNPFFENGTITIVGNPHVRVGKRLIINSESENEKQYYIEGYEDSWSYPGEIWIQTLTVTRGQDANERPLHISQRRGNIFNVSKTVFKGIRR